MGLKKSTCLVYCLKEAARYSRLKNSTKEAWRVEDWRIRNKGQGWEMYTFENVIN